MPQHGLEELECRQCSPRPPPELMHAGSDRRASKRGRQSGLQLLQPDTPDAFRLQKPVGLDMDLHLGAELGTQVYSA